MIIFIVKSVIAGTPSGPVTTGLAQPKSGPGCVPAL
jgi:hypothetical protein